MKRNVAFLILISISVLAISCEKTSIEKKSKNDEQLNFGKLSDYYVSDTVLFRFYNYYLEAEFGELNISPSLRITEDGDTIFYYHAYEGNTITGTLVSWSTLGNARNGYFIDISNLEIEDSTISDGSARIMLLNGEVLGRYYFNSHGEFTSELLCQGVNTPAIEGEYGMIGWLECTARCYIDSKAACDADPECDNMCDFANMVGLIVKAGALCNEAVAIACGVTCANNSYHGGGLPMLFLHAHEELQEGFPNGALY